MDTRIMIPLIIMFFQNYGYGVVMLFLMQSKILFAFFTARAHHVQHHAHHDPSFPAKLLSSWVAPNVYRCRGLFLPKSRNSFYWTSWGCSQPISAAGEGLSRWQQTLWSISYSSHFITSLVILGKHSLTSSVITCCSLHVASVYSNSVEICYNTKESYF